MRVTVRNIGRVGCDDFESLLAERREPIALHEAHSDRMAGRVPGCDGKRLGRCIRCAYLCITPRVRNGHRDRPAAGAQIEHLRRPAAGDKRERLLDNQFRFRAWNENTRVHVQGKTAELALTREVGNRLARSSPDE